MEHVEEAGVHSGDSSCVLPAPVARRQDAGADRRDRPSGSRRRSESSGSSTSSSRCRKATSSCSRRTRARRAPSRSRARRSASTSSRPRAASPPARACPTSTCPGDPSPEQVSVKAAVLPFARFPGADPVLGPEMRSTGEVMASAADLPTALAKAERAAGAAAAGGRHRIPLGARRGQASRDRSRRLAVEARVPPRRDRRHGARARCRRNRGRARAQGDRAGRGPDRRRPRPARTLRPGRSTRPSATRARARTAISSARPRSPRASRASRRSPARGPRSGRSPTLRATSPCRSRNRSVRRREALRVVANEAVGPYALIRVEAWRARAGHPGAVLHARGAGSGAARGR